MKTQVEDLSFIRHEKVGCRTKHSSAQSVMLGVEEVHEPLAECGTAPSSELRCVYYLIPLVLGTLIVLGMQAVLGHAVCPWIFRH